MFSGRFHISMSWKNLLDECSLTMYASVNILRLYTAKTLSNTFARRNIICKVEEGPHFVIFKGKVCLVSRKQAQRGGRVIAVPTLDPDTRKGFVISATLQPLYPRGREPLPTLQEAGLASGPV